MKEEGVRAYLRQVADEQGWERYEDDAGNIVLRVPGRGRGTDAAPLAIQGHMDMVCVKEEGLEHDFERDPIRVRRAVVMLEGEPVEVVTADGTTLGSDNAIGCCAGLALGLASGLDHPPLELLFTADEETGMTGASNLDPRLIRASRMLNLDAEEHGSLYISCAGGRDLSAVWGTPHQGFDDTFALLEVEISGLTGGHSGLDIGEGRANAVVELVKLLVNVFEDTEGLGLRSLQGGTRSNAIPRRASAQLWVPKSQIPAVTECFRREGMECCRRFAVTDPLARTRCDVAALDDDDDDAARVGLGAQDALVILRAIAALRDGVFSWSSEVDDLVETSSNLGVLTMSAEELSIQVLSRSSVDLEVERLQDRMSSVLEHAGADVTFFGAYPGWSPDLDNPLLAAAIDVYRRRFGAPPEVKAIHAGLECGVLKKRLPGVDLLSFGPEIRNAHTTDEMVVVDSVQAFWILLKDLASELCTSTTIP